MLGGKVPGQAYAQMSISKAANADLDTTTLISSTLETHANRVESAYRNTLQDFIAAESTPAAAPWDMDKYDRGY